MPAAQYTESVNKLEIISQIKTNKLKTVPKVPLLNEKGKLSEGPSSPFVLNFFAIRPGVSFLDGR
jgi:hypothetical protein